MSFEECWADNQHWDRSEYFLSISCVPSSRYPIIFSATPKESVLLPGGNRQVRPVSFSDAVERFRPRSAGFHAHVLAITVWQERQNAGIRPERTAAFCSPQSWSVTRVCCAFVNRCQRPRLPCSVSVSALFSSCYERAYKTFSMEYT